MGEIGLEVDMTETSVHGVEIMDRERESGIVSDKISNENEHEDVERVTDRGKDEK